MAVPLVRRVPAALRLLTALAVLGLFVYAYLSPSLASNSIMAALAKWQFSAALSGAGVAGVTVIVLLPVTVLFGRIFCSVLCPLGTAQELLWRLGNLIRMRKKGKSPRAGYRAAPKIRYLIPLLAGIGAALAFSPLMMVFDPISNFGRMMGALRSLFGKDSGVFPLLIAVPPVLILLAAVFHGRAFCNWCPVGLTLGLLSRLSPFAVSISAKCVSCGICEKKCPARCIASKGKKIEAGRCVLCFSCAASCPQKSVGYGPRLKAPAEVSPEERAMGDTSVFLRHSPEAADTMRPADESRRVFLKRMGRASLFCGAAYLLGPSLKLFARAPAGEASASAVLWVLPPGAGSLWRYSARCIGCQTCVASCPAGVIKTKDSPFPALYYTESGCQYNCVECGRVCPTGAIHRLDMEEKHRTRIALSTLYFERCVVNTRRESCGACAEVCPTGAITMVLYNEPGIPYLTRPVFEEAYCIGCGACYAACPAEPRAFTIAAATEQTLTVGPRSDEESGDELRLHSGEDFPF
ncbi:MAG: 4Fe-4S binding protein [Treponema sp.]|jgi:polyferredoxin|nr:4Fe-4S binding protein [Treponema sp.]